jgi:tetratricopeptide (TPR) repeat protein
VPHNDKGEQLYLRAKLRRELADAQEAGSKTAEAEQTRRAALADWDQLVSYGLTPEAVAESGLERSKLLYQLGDREQALDALEKAIDAAPDRGSTYADAIAFLIARGELDEALDAYHRALGRNEVTDYLKVYCSLWIVDLARRAKQPEDPLATAYLQSTDGAKWYDDLARWATGRESEAKLLERADTPARKAEASFYRAMRAYGEGRTDEAKGLWKQVLDTDMMAFFEYDMASYYLKLGGAPARPTATAKSK